MLGSLLSSVAGVAKTAAPIVEAGTNLYGMYSAYKGGKEADAARARAEGRVEDVGSQYQELYGLEQERYKDEKAMRDYVKQLAQQQMAYAERMGDEGLYKKALGVYNDILSGKFPSALFHNIANEMDYELVSQLKNIDQAAETERERIATMVPDGGVRTRMLSELAMNAADKKAEAMQRTAQQRRKVYTDTFKDLFDKSLTQGLAQFDIGHQKYGDAAKLLAPFASPTQAGMSAALRGAEGVASGGLEAAAKEQADYGRALETLSGNLAKQIGDTRRDEEPLVERNNPDTTRSTTSTRSAPRDSRYVDNWATFGGR